MKLLLLALLAAAICVDFGGAEGKAHSLQCYTCESQSSNDNCKAATNCSTGPGTKCKTEVWAYGVGRKITKKCVSSACVEKYAMISGVGHYTTCCGSDLCNANSATSVKISYAVLAVTVGFTGLLLKGGL